MEHRAFVEVVTILEDGPGKYSILLHDPDGAGWELPSGPLLEVKNEEQEFPDDPNAVYTVSCAHYLDECANFPHDCIEPDLEGEIGIYAYQWLRERVDSEVDITHFIYYCLVDTEQRDVFEKALAEKNGNARFFEFTDSKMAVKMKYDVQEKAIEMVMGHFNQKVN